MYSEKNNNLNKQMKLPSSSRESLSIIKHAGFNKIPVKSQFSLEGRSLPNDSKLIPCKNK